MKNLKYLAGIVLILTTFTFTSCDNEPIDPEIDLNDFNQNCDVPSSFQSSQFINENSVSLSWVAGDDESSWSIQYGIAGFSIGSGSIVNTTETTYVVNGLNSANSYSFYLRANCSSNSFSQWIGPVNVNAVSGGTSCNVPSGLTAVRNSPNNTIVNLSWTAGGNETIWEVQYGISGFSLGSGTIVESTSVTKQVHNLATNNQYSFYVRSKCSDNQFSNWVGPVNVNAVNTLPTIGYMNANVNGVQYNQMKPAYYTVTGLAVGVDYNMNVSDSFKLLKIQGNSDPFFTSTSGVEINLYIGQDSWQPGTYVLKGALNSASSPDDYPRVDIIINEPGEVVYENELPGTITILEFNSATKRIKGTFSFSYNTSDGNGTIGGPFQVTNGEFEFTLKDEVFQ